MEAFGTAAAWARKMAVQHADLVRTTSILRPGWGEKLGRRYLNTYTRGIARLPALLTHTAHHDTNAIAARAPGLRQGATMAVEYGPTFVITLPGLLARETQALLQLGVVYRQELVDRLHWTPQGWRAEPTPGLHDAVVLAPGSQLARWFPEAPCRLNGGEIATCPAPFDLESALSGGGHIAQDAQGRWVFGATYHRMDSEGEAAAFWHRSPEDARAGIVPLISRLVPAVAEILSQSIDIWRGVRMVYAPDRQPVAGGLESSKDLYVLGALGSKGCLWAPWLAAALARQIHGGPPVGGVASTVRLTGSQWRSPWIT